MSIYDVTHESESRQGFASAGLPDELFADHHEPESPEYSPEDEAAMYAAYQKDCRIRELHKGYARVCHSFASDGRRSGWWCSEVIDGSGTKYAAGKYRNRDAGWAAADALAWELAEAEYDAANRTQAVPVVAGLLDIPCQSCGIAILSDGGTLCTRCQKASAA